MAETIRLVPGRDDAEINELLVRAHKLLQRQASVFLSTQGEDGFPHTRAMLNLRNPEWFPGLTPLFAAHERDIMLLFTTNTSSHKHAQIMRDPRVCAYVCRENQFQGLSLFGEIEIVTDAAFKQQVWQPGWEQYYPEGVTSEDFAVLRLFPQRVVLYQGLSLREIVLPL